MFQALVKVSSFCHFLPLPVTFCQRCTGRSWEFVTRMRSPSSRSTVSSTSSAAYMSQWGFTLKGFGNLYRSAATNNSQSANCRFDRKASGDFTLRGIKVAKGAYITASGYVCHHDPTAWEDVDSFVPERYPSTNWSCALMTLNDLNVIPLVCRIFLPDRLTPKQKKSLGHLDLVSGPASLKRFSRWNSLSWQSSNTSR